MPDIQEKWGKYVRGMWKEHGLIAGTRTVGHALLQWLEAFVTAAGVGRHRLTALH